MGIEPPNGDFSLGVFMAMLGTTAPNADDFGDTVPKGVMAAKEEAEALTFPDTGAAARADAEEAAPNGLPEEVPNGVAFPNCNDVPVENGVGTAEPNGEGAADVANGVGASVVAIGFEGVVSLEPNEDFQDFVPSFPSVLVPKEDIQDFVPPSPSAAPGLSLSLSFFLASPKIPPPDTCAAPDANENGDKEAPPKADGFPNAVDLDAAAPKPTTVADLLVLGKLPNPEAVVG